MPVKTSLLFTELLRFGQETGSNIHFKVDLKEYVNGTKAHLEFFLLKLRGII